MLYYVTNTAYKYQGSNLRNTTLQRLAMSLATAVDFSTKSSLLIIVLFHEGVKRNETPRFTKFDVCGGAAGRRELIRLKLQVKYAYRTAPSPKQPDLHINMQFCNATYW